MQNEYDLVIIGSGAGGAPIAHELARKGKSVLMLEKGPLILPQYQATTGVSGFRRDEAFSTGAEKILRLDVANKGMPYYSSHVEPDLNDEPHIYRRADGSDDATIEGYTAQVVGGGTQLYGGVSLRFTPRDLTLAQWNNRPGAALDGDPNDEVRREARDWPFPYATLEPYYAKAEALVGINGEVANQRKPFTSGDKYQKPLAYNPISEHVKAGMDALGMPHYRTPLAVITAGSRAERTQGSTAGRGGEDGLRQSLRRSDGVQVLHLGLAAEPDQGSAELHAAAELHRDASVIGRRAHRPGALPGTRRHAARGLRPHRHRRLLGDRERAAAQAVRRHRPDRLRATHQPGRQRHAGRLLPDPLLRRRLGAGIVARALRQVGDARQRLRHRLLPRRRVPRRTAHLGRRGHLQQHLGPRAAAGAGAQLREP